MTPKQKTFCQEYIVDQNITQAALRAGYAKRSAGQQGERMMKKDEISKYIDKLLEKQAKRIEITADRILNEIASISFDTEVNETHRLKGLELLGKNQKLFTDKVELGGETTVKVIKKRFDGE